MRGLPNMIANLGGDVLYAEKLSSDEIEPLCKLYNEIKTRGHSPLINGWHQGRSCKRTCPPETTWPIYGLLCLFAQLRETWYCPIQRWNSWSRRTEDGIGLEQAPSATALLS